MATPLEVVAEISFGVCNFGFENAHDANGRAVVLFQISTLSSSPAHHSVSINVIIIYTMCVIISRIVNGEQGPTSVLLGKTFFETRSRLFQFEIVRTLCVDVFGTPF